MPKQSGNWWIDFGGRRNSKSFRLVRVQLQLFPNFEGKGKRGSTLVGERAQRLRDLIRGRFTGTLLLRLPIFILLRMPKQSGDWWIYFGGRRNSKTFRLVRVQLELFPIFEGKGKRGGALVGERAKRLWDLIRGRYHHTVASQGPRAIMTEPPNQPSAPQTAAEDFASRLSHETTSERVVQYAERFTEYAKKNILYRIVLDIDPGRYWI
ncbi:hypothetical protein WH47_11553 [Habropoda laboriosa]|uniref:Uncharacterized protein n=1 Tax=Habropoda laboriosa TaxID=597456 RepID=A0A0L7QLZ3_9HYME|nr:hypothetical protein WH47_11553 [Habropoda laboriosa]